MADRVQRVEVGDITVSILNGKLVLLRLLNRRGARVWEEWPLSPEEARVLAADLLAAADHAN